MFWSKSRCRLVPLVLVALGSLGSAACVSQSDDPNTPTPSSLNSGSQFNAYGSLDDELDNETLKGLDEPTYGNPFAANSPFVPSMKPATRGIGGGARASAAPAPKRKIQQASTKKAKRPMAKAAKRSRKK